MMVRTGFLIGCTALAYALLRGWPDALPGVMKACFAVLACFAGLGVWAKRRRRENEASARARRSQGWLDYAGIGMAVLAVEGGFLWLLGTAPGPMESAGLVIERTFRPAAAARRALENGDGGTRTGNWLWTEETRRPLPKRTNFKPGKKPEVFLRFEDRADAQELMKGRIYVRAFALGRYESAGWSSLAGRPLEIKADESGFTQLAPARPGRQIRHEVFHAAEAGGQNALTALQGVTQARVSPLNRIDDGLFLLPPATALGGYQYLASSHPMRIEDLPDGGLVSGWPGAPDDLLALPPDGKLGARLQSLARTAAGTGTVKEQLLHVQDHLRTTFQYSLVTSNPQNLDPMENFLFEEKRGHCEYFATAGALLARALGLPSRVAYGWAGGTWYDSAGLLVFRANEAHAWTEIWLENLGWVSMDPTPQVTGTASARLALPGEALPGAAADATDPADSLAADPGTTLAQLGMWLMLGFGISAGFFGIWRGRRIPEDPEHHSGVTATPAPGYLKLWRRACAARGLPMPPGFTLRRQLARMPDRPEFAAELLAYHYGTRYEGRPQDPRFENLLAHRIREWENGFSGINPDA